MRNLSNIARYPTGVVAEYLNINPKTLINFENANLTNVEKNLQNRRRYSEVDIFKILLILFMLREKGLNYNGCRIVLKLTWDESLKINELKKVFSENIINNMINKASDI